MELRLPDMDPFPMSVLSSHGQKTHGIKTLFTLEHNPETKSPLSLPPLQVHYQYHRSLPQALECLSPLPTPNRIEETVSVFWDHLSLPDRLHSPLSTAPDAQQHLPACGC